MQRVHPIAAVVAAIVFLPPPAAAQEPDMAAFMEAITPDANHAALEPLTGSWNHAILFFQAPGAPPMEMTATSTSGMALGGRYLMSEFEGSFLGAPFTGRETMGYDKVKGKYFSVWVDNFGTGPMVLWGDYDAATKTFTMEGTVADPMSGDPEVEIRNTIQLLDDGSIHYENWGPAADGTMFKSMEIHSTKR